MSHWIDPAILALFVPTFFFVSVTPGMCMTLAMTLGMSLGVRRTLHMMWGSCIGVGLVSVLSVVGVAAVMLNYPALFSAFKYVGGAYLVWLGIQMWQAKGKMAIPADLSAGQQTRPLGLALQGFVTAIANPKGWAFMVSLLPPSSMRPSRWRHESAPWWCSSSSSSSPACCFTRAVAAPCATSSPGAATSTLDEPDRGLAHAVCRRLAGLRLSAIADVQQ